ncbi:hypothetical protein ACFXKI_09790 [Streptomyces mirabilis]|uniref:hypothetical protein n=1 Tax=Streptomyces mirabilis TaxID=68239 RepID=UPI0036C21C63
MTESSDYRVIEWWPSEEERRIISVARTPENEAMSDEELIASFDEWVAGGRQLRVVDDE